MSVVTILSMPFKWRHVHTEVRRQHESTANIRGDVDVPLEFVDADDVAPLASPTGDPRDTIHGYDGRLYRPLLGPDGEMVDPDRFRRFVEDPETVFAAWRDFPLHKKDGGYASLKVPQTQHDARLYGRPTPKEKDCDIKFGEDPARWGTVDDLNRKRLGRSFFHEDRDAALDLAGHLILVGQVVMMPAQMPSIKVTCDGDTITAEVVSAEQIRMQHLLDKAAGGSSADRTRHDVIGIFPCSVTSLVAEVLDRIPAPTNPSDHLEEMEVFDVGEMDPAVLQMFRKAAATKATMFEFKSLRDLRSAENIRLAADVFEAIQAFDGNKQDDELLLAACESLGRFAFKDAAATQFLATGYLVAKRREMENQATFEIDAEAIEAMTVR